MNVLFCERVLIKYGELKIKTLIQIIVQSDMQKHPSSLAVLAEDLRKLAEIHES